MILLLEDICLRQRLITLNYKHHYTGNLYKFDSFMKDNTNNNIQMNLLLFVNYLLHCLIAYIYQIHKQLIIFNPLSRIVL